LSLEENTIMYECFAPDIEQHHVINHLTGEELDEGRNVLQEASRIVRGNCKPLSDLNESDFDGLVVPGGFGVAKNLSDIAFSGDKFSINSQFMNICLAFKNSSKPAAYMCIAPALLCKLYEGIRCTIGNDADFSKIIEQHGGTHTETSVNEIVIDTSNKVVTTPCYMLAENISQARSGIVKLIGALREML